MNPVMPIAFDINNLIWIAIKGNKFVMYCPAVHIMFSMPKITPKITTLPVHKLRKQLHKT